MKYVLTVIITLVVLCLGAILYAWSGMYNMAATEPHRALTLSFIEMLRDRSIAAHSSNIKAPNLDNDELWRKGFNHYHETCRLCHGAPGYKPEELAEGLYPAAPKLASREIHEDLDNAEIFWVVKYGLKMTGMPAFGPTHDEAELWGIVAMVKQVPKLSPDQYRHLAQSIGIEEEAGHHSHKGSEEAIDADHGHGHN